MTLDQLREGQRGRVAQLALSGTIRRRLQELGLIDCTPISCCRIGPGGTLAAYFFRGTVVALRREDARHILICPETSN
jgi:ferrous iron transport protein A